MIWWNVVFAYSLKVSDPKLYIFKDNAIKDLVFTLTICQPILKTGFYWNKIRDLFKVKLYTITSLNWKKRSRERDCQTDWNHNQIVKFDWISLTDILGLTNKVWQIDWAWLADQIWLADQVWLAEQVWLAVWLTPQLNNHLLTHCWKGRWKVTPINPMFSVQKLDGHEEMIPMLYHTWV